MGERLTRTYLKALSMALATLGDVAAATGRAYRTLQAYRRGETQVPPHVARTLAGYLRARARTFTRTADALDRAATREERR